MIENLPLIIPWAIFLAITVPPVVIKSYKKKRKERAFKMNPIKPIQELERLISTVNTMEIAEHTRQALLSKIDSEKYFVEYEISKRLGNEALEKLKKEVKQ